MLELKLIRENPTKVQELLNRRSAEGYDIQPVLELDRKARELETNRSQLSARSNEIGKAIGQKMRSGGDSKSAEIIALKEEGNQLKTQLAELEPKEKELKSKINQLLQQFPNLPSESTPIGKNETENVEVTHIYTTPGKYSVSLTVENEYASSAPHSVSVIAFVTYNDDFDGFVEGSQPSDWLETGSLAFSVFEKDDNSVSTLSKYLSKNNIDLFCMGRGNKKSQNKRSEKQIKGSGL